MTPTQMLAELTKSYNVKIWVETDSAHEPGYRLELFLREGDLSAANGDFAARYAEPNLDKAIARAWAGETPDG